MYSREIDGGEFDFGVSGKLIRNVLVMYDRQTNSLWSQLLGIAIEGEMAGSSLEYLPSWMTNWEDWKTRHPDTLAIVKGFSGGYDTYAGYYSSASPGVIGESIQDDRLYTKEWVIGIEINGEAKAYPFSALNFTPVVNDEVGGVPILVVFNKDTGAGAVFARNIEENTYSFSLSNEETLLITDDQTGTEWDGLTGEAVSGDLFGTTLSRIKFTGSFWFGWKDWYPDTHLYTVEFD